MFSVIQPMAGRPNSVTVDPCCFPSEDEPGNFQQILRQRKKGIKTILRDRKKGIKQIQKARRKGIEEILEERRRGIEEILNQENVSQFTQFGHRIRELESRLNSVEKMLKVIQSEILFSKLTR